MAELEDRPPTTSRAMITDGLQWLRRGETRRALHCFAEAEQTEDPSTLATLGAIYDHSLNEVGHAEACYRRAADRGSILAMSNLGSLLLAQDRFDEALQWLHRAAASGHADALNTLATALDQHGHREEAFHYYDRAARAGQPQAMCAIVLRLVMRGQWRDARRWYQRAEATRDPRIQDPLLILKVLLSSRARQLRLARHLLRETSD